VFSALVQIENTVDDIPAIIKNGEAFFNSSHYFISEEKDPANSLLCDKSYQHAGVDINSEICAAAYHVACHQLSIFSLSEQYSHNNASIISLSFFDNSFKGRAPPSII
jgi:hypothetical protein